MSLVVKLTAANETAWLHIGALAEGLADSDKALFAYEQTLRQNPYNLKALLQVAQLSRAKDQHAKAAECYQRILNLESSNGEVWGALGYSYLMLDDLQKAYTAYQQALYHLPNAKDPSLWYGIGILYDRYGSLEHAEEAFSAVLKMDAKFDRANEVHFRLGVIYKQQGKYEQSLESFRLIVKAPPKPLTQADIWFQIGHVHELQKDFHAAKEAYERVLKDSPNHGKVLQQLGWLYHHNTAFGNQELAIAYLTRSIEAEPNDGQTWYLLGRCYMAQQKYRKAYDAYQQAVYRDSANPTFWCSIGVLYYQINQYRDALDAYSRAIRLNPFLSEVWYDLGTLYESCNQISDSLDAYQRAAELEPANKQIQQRLAFLRNASAAGATAAVGAATAATAAAVGGAQSMAMQQAAGALGALASAARSEASSALVPTHASASATPNSAPTSSINALAAAAGVGAASASQSAAPAAAGAKQRSLANVAPNSPESIIPSLSELVRATDDPRHKREVAAAVDVAKDNNAKDSKDKEPATEASRTVTPVTTRLRVEIKAEDDSGAEEAKAPTAAPASVSAPAPMETDTTLAAKTAIPSSNGASKEDERAEEKEKSKRKGGEGDEEEGEAAEDDEEDGAHESSSVSSSTRGKARGDKDATRKSSSRSNRKR